MKPETETRLRKDYAHDVHRRCYRCEQQLSLDDLIGRLKNGIAFIQSFTGRMFCSEACRDEYLRSEGLV